MSTKCGYVQASRDKNGYIIEYHFLKSMKGDQRLRGIKPGIETYETDLTVEKELNIEYKIYFDLEPNL